MSAFSCLFSWLLYSCTWVSFFLLFWLLHPCTLVSAVSYGFDCSIPALSCQLFPVLWLQHLCTLMSAVSCCFDCSIPALFQLFPSRHYPFAVSAVFLTAVVVHSFHCLTFCEMTLLKSLFTVLFFCCSRFYKNLHCHHRSKDGVSQASIHCLYVLSQQYMWMPGRGEGGQYHEKYRTLFVNLKLIRLWLNDRHLFLDFF